MRDQAPRARADSSAETNPDSVRIELGSLDAETVGTTAASAYDAERPPVPHAPDALPDPMVGRRVDHFLIRGLIGRGGMGSVYLAHDESLDRPVALKFLRADLADDPRLVEHLVQEARAQARLAHPNIITIHYIGRHGKVPYFAMAYVRGVSLDDQIVAQGPIPWAEALEHIIDAARALAGAHKRGIIHRDIKPSNLILTVADRADEPRGQVMVADFGLAAKTGDGAGTFLGTPHYASPEQIEGGVLDHRSDMYALGITFFELLTGTRPFEGRTMNEIFAKHRSSARPTVPPDKAPAAVRALIAEMMHPDPARRPPDYASLIERLKSARPVDVVSAGLVPRAMALAVDLTLLAMVGQALVSSLGMSQIAANSCALALFAVHYVICLKLWRKTLGKRLLDIEVRGVRRSPTWARLGARFAVEFWGPLVALVMLNLQLGAATDLEAVRRQLTAMGLRNIPIVDDTLQALLRTVLVPNVVLAIPWLGGFFVAAFLAHRQALHDLAAGTRVVVSTPAR